MVRRSWGARRDEERADVRHRGVLPRGGLRPRPPARGVAGPGQPRGRHHRAPARHPRLCRRAGDLLHPRMDRRAVPRAREGHRSPESRDRLPWLRAPDDPPPEPPGVRQGPAARPDRHRRRRGHDGDRVPRPHLLGGAGDDVEPRGPLGGRLPLRLEHLPHRSRSVRHPGRPPLPAPRVHHQRTRDRRVSPFHHHRAGTSGPHRGGRIFPAPPLPAHPALHPAPEHARAPARHRLPASLGAGCPPAQSARGLAEPAPALSQYPQHRGQAPPPARRLPVRPRPGHPRPERRPHPGRSALKITAVVGARPNFVKIAPIVAELRTRPDVTTTLVHTGQHYDGPMSDAFFANLELPDPDVNLHVQAGSATAQVAEIMLRLEPVLAASRPDIVLVVGDVNSTLAGALTAAKMGLRLAHVEAGLRSFDWTMPEEINRVITDSVADFLFTTEPAANENLAREGVRPEQIHFVGNVMIDTLFRYKARARESSILATLGVQARSYSLLTLHRPSNVDSEDTLRPLLDVISRIQSDSAVVFPVHPRTRRQLERVNGHLPAMANLRLVDPLPYLDFVQLMANASCVLTDSGGIQEETTALGIPCLTLRKNTERPITVSRGTNRVLGGEPAAVHEHWRQAVGGQWPAGQLPELWDGKAAQRIVRILLEARCCPSRSGPSPARASSGPPAFARRRAAARFPCSPGRARWSRAS